MTDGPARRVIFTTTQSRPEHISALSGQGAEIFIIGDKRVNLVKALDMLHSFGIRRLMVEGGGSLNFELLRRRLVDELVIFIAPKIFGGKTAPTLADGEGLIEKAGVNLKLLDVQILDETGGITIRYQCLALKT
jgi:2,5-diamino-6-(ribosylamino)-4(3H)-pyrimidinone 5'-phosphate reductase